MNKDQIIRCIKSHLSERDGKDYYDYEDVPHWYGIEDDIYHLAVALKSLFEQEKLK